MEVQTVRPMRENVAFRVCKSLQNSWKDGDVKPPRLCRLINPAHYIFRSSEPVDRLQRSKGRIKFLFPSHSFVTGSSPAVLRFFENLVISRKLQEASEDLHSTLLNHLRRINRARIDHDPRFSDSDSARYCALSITR